MQHVRANTPGNRATLQPKPTQALNYSFISNLVLLGVRVAVAVLSQSLALMVTTLDAVLDVIRYGTWASQERAVVQYTIVFVFLQGRCLSYACGSVTRAVSFRNGDWKSYGAVEECCGKCAYSFASSFNVGFRASNCSWQHSWMVWVAELGSCSYQVPMILMLVTLTVWRETASATCA
jgi:hypothetical protein